MNLRDTFEWCFWFGLLAFVFLLAIGCGQVSSRAGAVEGGEGGRAGIGPELEAAAGQGGAVDVDAAAAADAPPPPACIDDNTAGLALNPTCDGGSAAGQGCHAACTLNGAPFVGCVSRPSGPIACYASCGACGGL